MDQHILCFFEKKPGALPLYEVFERKVFAEVGDVDVKVQKTQIAFANKLDAGKAKGYQFAFVSFAPVRKAKERPEDYITVTFGLGHRVESPPYRRGSGAVSEPLDASCTGCFGRGD